MPSITVTDELRKLIRSERKLRKIRVDELSTELKKSTSFISQLENGKIPELDLDTFYKLFDKIIDLPNEKRQEYINNIIKDLSVKLSPDEIKKQEWMYTFDLQSRLFPITEQLIDFIVDMRKKLNISPENLVEEINMNKDLTDAEKFEYNQLKIERENNKISYSIRFKFEENLISDIENKKITKINYINMLGIIYNLYLLDGKNKYDAMILAEDLLRKNEFIRLQERSNYIESKLKEKIAKEEDFEFYDLVPTDLEREFRKSLDEIISGFDYICKKNISYAHRQTIQLEKNMNDEIFLMFAIFGLPFNELKDLDVETKKDFILKLRTLIESYEHKTKTADIPLNLESK